MLLDCAGLVEALQQEFLYEHAWCSQGGREGGRGSTELCLLFKAQQESMGWLRSTLPLLQNTFWV